MANKEQDLLNVIAKSLGVKNMAPTLSLREEKVINESVGVRPDDGVVNRVTSALNRTITSVPKKINTPIKKFSNISSNIDESLTHNVKLVEEKKDHIKFKLALPELVEELDSVDNNLIETSSKFRATPKQKVSRAPVIVESKKINVSELNNKVMSEFTNIIAEEKQRKLKEHQKLIEEKKRVVAERKLLEEQRLRNEQATKAMELHNLLEEQKRIITKEKALLEREKQALAFKQNPLVNKISLKKSVELTEEVAAKSFFNLTEAKAQPAVVSRPQALASAISSMAKMTPKQDNDSGISENVRAELAAIRKATAEFKQVANKIVSGAGSHGGGEVNLKYLDDVDTSALADGAVLRWDATKKKFTFGNATPVVSTSVFNQAQFMGTGSLSTFTVPFTTDAESLFLYINGIQQDPSYAYTLVGTTLTLITPPGPGDIISLQAPANTSILSFVESPAIGDGSATAFVYDPGADANSIIVTINGVIQIPGSAYVVSATSIGATTTHFVNFSNTVATGDLIDIRVPTVASGNTFSMVDNQFIGNGTTMVYTLSTPSTSNDAFVSINGVSQVSGLAYSLSGTTLTFASPVILNDVIDVRIPLLT